MSSLYASEMEKYIYFTLLYLVKFSSNIHGGLVMCGQLNFPKYSQWSGARRSNEVLPGGLVSGDQLKDT